MRYPYRKPQPEGVSRPGSLGMPADKTFWRAPLWFLGCALLLFSFGSAAQDSNYVRSYVVGVSPFLEKPTKDLAYRKLITFVIEEMPLGSSLRVYDAYNLQTITEVTIPQVQAFKSSKTRANQLAGQIQKLRLFLATEHPQPGRGVSPSSGAIRLPQFLDFVRGSGPSVQEPLSLIILGNPLYMDPKEPSFSMANGYFPSDGHLLVGRDKSVFGVTERTNALRHFAVHFAYFNDPWVSDLHREKITRFWRLFLESQGGTLPTLSGDLATVFKNARLRPDTDAPPQLSAHIDPTQTKLEMYRITRDVASKDWITTDTISAASERPASTVGPMKIGIRWQGAWDLDLYASPKPGSKTLFFQHTRIPEGYYYKDHRASPDREYEFIEFTSPVDVFEVEAMVNFFAGSARGGVSGEVRIEFEGRIYSGTFHIEASGGNRGRMDAAQAEYWTSLNIPELLHLRSDDRVAVNRDTVRPR